MQAVLITICGAFVLEMFAVIFAAGRLFQKVANLKETFDNYADETNRRLVRLENGAHCRRHGDTPD